MPSSLPFLEFALAPKPEASVRDVDAVLLARVEAALGASSDEAVSLRVFAWLLVPTFADWVIVDRLRDGALVRVAVAYADPSATEAGEALRRSPVDGDAATLAARLHTGPLLFEGGSTIGGLLPGTVGVRPRSAIVAPLQGPAGWRGVATFLRTERSFEAEDLTLARALAERVAAAVESAHAADAAHSPADGVLVAERGARLIALSAAFSEAMRPEDVADVVVRQGLAVLGARSGSIAALHEDRAHVVLLGATGYAPETLSRYDRLPVTTRFPLADVIRTGEPVFLSDLAARLAAYPQHEALARANGPGGMATLPLRVRQGVIGALGLTFREPRPFDEAERRFLRRFAHVCAQALDRALLLDAEERSRERLYLLARASELLASSLDYEETLRQVATIAMPSLADFCFFDVREESGLVRRFAGADGDPVRQALIEQSRWERPTRTGVVLCALSTGVPALHPIVDEALLQAAAASPAQVELLRTLGVRSLMTVPLTVRGEVLGALTLCRTGRDAYTESDLLLAEELARRAAAAVVNAQLFSQAQRAVELRDRFLSIAGHELNTPITSLKLQLAMMNRPTTSPERAARQLQLARRQVDRLADLVRDLLDVSRIRAGRLLLEREAVDVFRAAQDVVERFEEELGRSGSTLSVNVAGDATAHVDPGQLDQVLTNLLSNAIKYGDGKPIALEVVGLPDAVRVIVRDYGIGIDAEARSRLFGPFERAVSARHYGGFGLGLWITKQVVEAHGGTITLASVPDAGSIFEVTFPRAAP